MSKFKELIDGSTAVLVDMYADWCGPCKALAPELKTLKQSVGDKVKIIKIDVDKNTEVANKFNVRGVPTMILFKEGKILWRQSGVMDTAAIEKEIESFL